MKTKIATAFLFICLAFLFRGTASAQTQVYARDTISYHQCGALTQKGTPCKITVPKGTEHCHFHNQPKADPAAGKTIYVGPRGGHYYLVDQPDGTIKKVYIQVQQ